MSLFKAGEPKRNEQRLFAAGDKVQRKEPFQKVNGWLDGGTVFTLEEDQKDSDIKVLDYYWHAHKFDLVKEPETSQDSFEYEVSDGLHTLTYPSMEDVVEDLKGLEVVKNSLEYEWIETRSVQLGDVVKFNTGYSEWEVVETEYRSDGLTTFKAKCGNSVTSSPMNSSGIYKVKREKAPKKLVEAPKLTVGSLTFNSLEDVSKALSEGSIEIVEKVKVKDGWVKLGDMVWCHSVDGPEKVRVNHPAHLGNMKKYSDSYSIKKPEFVPASAGRYTGNYE